MTELVQPFKENLRSFASRLRTDCRQIEYLAELAIFSDELHRKKHLSEIRDYLKKLEDSLDAMEKLEQKEESPR